MPPEFNPFQASSSMWFYLKGAIPSMDDDQDIVDYEVLDTPQVVVLEYVNKS